MSSSTRASDIDLGGGLRPPSDPPPGVAQAKPALERRGFRAVGGLGSRVVGAVRWTFRFARRKPLGALGGIIVVAMLVMAVFAERIAPYNYDETIRGARMVSPRAAHWLGTDNLSRDMWSRIVYGARVSVSVGFLPIALATLMAPG